MISDVHGNIDALEAVIRDIKVLGIHDVVCLGDIVGYGGAPAECVRTVGEYCAAVVMGNHEAMAVVDDALYLEDLPARISRPLELARRVLSTAELDWLAQLPLITVTSVYEAVHATLDRPGGFSYIFTPEEARKNFKHQRTPVSFHGHSHVPVIWEEREDTVVAYRPKLNNVRLAGDRRYAVNVGSVGQPRDGDPRACYVVYDAGMRDLTFRRVEYDIDAARRRIFSSQLPRPNADRLSRGE